MYFPSLPPPGGVCKAPYLPATAYGLPVPYGPVPRTVILSSASPGKWEVRGGGGAQVVPAVMQRVDTNVHTSGPRPRISHYG